MSERQFGAWLGRPMDDRDIDDLLSSTGHGILSLARKGEAYGIPVSFGYDGADRIYVALLETDPPQQKFQFAETTERASLTVTDIDTRFNWESVVVRGPFRETDPDSETFDAMLTTLDDNAWFSSTYVRDSGLDSLHGYVLEVDEITGLQKQDTA